MTIRTSNILRELVVKYNTYIVTAIGAKIDHSILFTFLVVMIRVSHLFAIISATFLLAIFRV